MVVTEESIHERLRLARMASGVSIDSLAKRSGMRAEWFYAIDTGRCIGHDFYPFGGGHKCIRHGDIRRRIPRGSTLHLAPL